MNNKTFNFWQFISENAVFLHAAVHFDIIVFFQKIYSSDALCHDQKNTSTLAFHFIVVVVPALQMVASAEYSSRRWWWWLVVLGA